MTAQPLSDERLAEIREHVANTTNWSLGNLAARDLLAEVQRLKAELGQMTAARNTVAALYRDADSRLDSVLNICDREQRNAMRWENPIPVPEWVAVVQRAALGDDKRTEAAR